ncbi:MAG TPA: hypothetical protein PKC28_06820 [Bdellovibrionales bacterium]|nr:hypothetical protein [Bdellovibrionales bacterium]
MRRIERLALALFFAIHGFSWASESAEKHESREEADHTTDLADRAAKQSSRDVKLPRALVGRIEKEYREFLTKKNAVSEKEPIKRRLLNVNVELTQRRAAALHEPVRIATPLGGGVVDFAEFVTPLRGSFQLRIRPRKDDNADLSDARVFYVSRAKARKIDGENYGAGCDKYMEITTMFYKKMNQSGFELFTTDQRYLTVMAGTFVIVAFEKDALHVGSVTFTDSRYPERLCE